MFLEVRVCLRQISNKYYVRENAHRFLRKIDMTFVRVFLKLECLDYIFNYIYV
jgi:hypothetical protein